MGLIILHLQVREFRYSPWELSVTVSKERGSCWVLISPDQHGYARLLPVSAPTDKERQPVFRVGTAPLWLRLGGFLSPGQRGHVDFWALGIQCAAALGMPAACPWAALPAGGPSSSATPCWSSAACPRNLVAGGPLPADRREAGQSQGQGSC